MTDTALLHCQSCGWSYFPGEARYCSKCGELLAAKSINPAQEIKKLESEPRPYEALRFTSGLIVFMGWMVIVFGWIIALTFGTSISIAISKYVVSENASDSVLQNWNALVIFIFGCLNTIPGIFMIASGQVFAVLLDIRNDTHITARLIRRFGLIMSEK